MFNITHLGSCAPHNWKQQFLQQPRSNGLSPSSYFPVTCKRESTHNLSGRTSPAEGEGDIPLTQLSSFEEKLLFSPSSFKLRRRWCLLESRGLSEPLGHGIISDRGRHAHCNNICMHARFFTYHNYKQHSASYTTIEFKGKAKNRLACQKKQLSHCWNKRVCCCKLTLGARDRERKVDSFPQLS